ncbi:MAG: cation:proton antiporter [Planctomycetes bacterium]|nr:cation:proton antiporter [Planctomycetota bacterium]
MLLATALVLGALAEKLRQSAIVGFLLAGMLLGPNVFGFVRNDAEVGILAELGVALLLFAIGLEFSWRRLRGLGAASLAGGATQVGATTMVAAAAAYIAGQPGQAALAIGAIIALSSTASVLHIMRMRAELESVHGGHALAVLLVQDLAVVPLVLLVSVLAGSGSGGLAIAQHVGKVVALIAAVVAGLYVTFNYVAPWLLRFGPLYGNRELSVLLAMVSGLGSTVLAHEVGISPALGAFVAGLLLGESPFAVQVRADTASLRTLFVTVFFSSIGMFGDPSWMLANWLLLSIGVLAIVVGKSLIAWLSLRAFGAPTASALAAGVCLGQIGEFSFILCEVARGVLISDHVFQLLVSAAVVTMLLTPYLVSAAPRVAGRLIHTLRMREPALTDATPQSERPRVLVIGFGPAGRVVAEQMREDGARVIVLDLNPHLVTAARRLGFEASVGDAQHEDVLRHLGVQATPLVAVTVPVPQVAVQIVHLLRVLAPEAFVVVRARYNRYLAEIEKAGAAVAHDEETHVGLRIAESMKARLASKETVVDEPIQQAAE